MNDLNRFINYCDNQAIAQEGFFTKLKEKFSKKSDSTSSSSTPSSYVWYNGVSGYDPIYNDKEKRIELVKKALQIANSLRKNTIFKENGNGIDLFKNTKDLLNGSEYDTERYYEFIEGKNNACVIGSYFQWDYAKTVNQNARELYSNGPTPVDEFIYDQLKPKIQKSLKGVYVTGEGGDWDDGPIELVIERW